MTIKAMTTDKRLAALLLVLLAATNAAAVAGRDAAARGAAGDGKSRMIVPLRSGAFLVFKTEAVPPGPEEVSTSFVESEERPNLVRRVFVGKEGETFFGYELSVEAVAGAREFRVSVLPLGAEYLGRLRARPSFQRLRPHPSYDEAAFRSAPQTVGDGDTFALDVLHNPRTGVKIVDFVTVSYRDPRLLEQAAGEGPPRDYTLEDVELRVTGYRLFVNGEAVNRGPGGGCTGALVWFSLPGRGRFIFSLVPRPGYDFRKVAAAEHNKISFEWEGVDYVWESRFPVVGAGGNWSLWVLHDADYRADLFDAAPAKPDTEAGGLLSRPEEAERRMRRQRGRAGFGGEDEAGVARPVKHVRVVVGAADGIEWLLPKK
jgi:hypothetical protein